MPSQGYLPVGFGGHGVIVRGLHGLGLVAYDESGSTIPAAGSLGLVAGVNGLHVPLRRRNHAASPARLATWYTVPADTPRGAK